MFATTQNPKIRIADLIRDPILAAIFRSAERDGMAGADIDRRVPPNSGCDAVAVRELELA